MEANDIHHRNITSNAIPYRSGLPMNAKENSTFLERGQKYQSTVGSIGWLTQSTCPDLAPSHSFISAYNNKPSRSHMNTALYVLHYMHSTIHCGFTFTSKAKIPLHTYMSFPNQSDTEAYDDDIPPRYGVSLG